MLIDFDRHPIPIGAPNPPPWEVLYLNELAIPSARTRGLLRLGWPDLQVRLARPDHASQILDRIGIWLLFEKNQIGVNDTILFDSTEYALVPAVEGDLPFLRLAWHRDPRPANGEMAKLTILFLEACKQHKVNL